MSDYDDNVEPASASDSIPSFSMNVGSGGGGNGGGNGGGGNGGTYQHQFMFAGSNGASSAVAAAAAAAAAAPGSVGRTPNMPMPMSHNNRFSGAVQTESIYAAGRTPTVTIAPRAGEMTEFGNNGGNADNNNLGAFGSTQRWQKAMTSNNNVYDDADDVSEDERSHATLNTSPEAFDNSKIAQTSGGDAPQLRKIELTTNPLRENVSTGVEWRKDMLDISLKPPPTDDEETLK